MKREDIEKAAKHYSCRDGSVSLKTEIYAFIEGAKWRINSVWHFDKSMPNPNEPFLFIFNKGVIVLQVISEEDWNLLVKDLVFVKWAYIKDLTPKEE